MDPKACAAFLALLALVLVAVILILVETRWRDALASCLASRLAPGKPASERLASGGRVFGGAGEASHHLLGDALERNLRDLELAPPLHDLAQADYTPALPKPGGGSEDEATGGGPRVKPPAAKKPWSQYETWDELRDDEGATKQYISQRAAAIKNPAFDWEPVLREVRPLLAEDREYIGLINVAPDGRTLILAALEASPVRAGEKKDSKIFASVPAEVVGRYIRRPALFIFHTHPADPRADPFPSSRDLSTAIHLSANTKYAADVVISRYGIFVYGLDWQGYSAIHLSAKDKKLAELNMCYDIVASHEASRSWSSHTIEDRIAFYRRHRLFLFVYPTADMVGDTRKDVYLHSLESFVDYDLVQEYHEAILAHTASQRGRGGPQVAARLWRH